MDMIEFNIYCNFFYNFSPVENLKRQKSKDINTKQFVLFSIDTTWIKLLRRWLSISNHVKPALYIGHTGVIKESHAMACVSWQSRLTIINDQQQREREWLKFSSLWTIRVPPILGEFWFWYPQEAPGLLDVDE